MNDEQYLQHCRAELEAFTQDMVKRTETLDDSDSLRELAMAFQQLTEVNSDLYGDGQTLVARLFTTYPDFCPTFPRELLWFLGGDCLHYMPDDEISQYQRLEEQREEAASRGEIIDFAAARAKLLKLQ
ncbi:MAG: PA2817 family protein [Halioglobus sp.]